MDVTPLIAPDRMVIQSYKGGCFLISGQSWTQSVLLYTDRVLPLGVTAPDALLKEHLTSLEAEVTLVGTGSQFMRPSPELRPYAEFMDTGAACRTFNILMTEGRDVAAILFPV